MVLKEFYTIIVSAPGVLAPREVRCGWRKGFFPTFNNRKGLPDSPFRTDDWPMETQDNVYLDVKLRRMQEPDRVSGQ